MSDYKIYKIKGMHCASCAGIIEKTLKKTEGVISAEANYGNESVKLSFDQNKINLESLSKKIEPLGYSFIFEKSSFCEVFLSVLTLLNSIIFPFFSKNL